MKKGAGGSNFRFLHPTIYPPLPRGCFDSITPFSVLTFLLPPFLTSPPIAPAPRDSLSRRWLRGMGTGEEEGESLSLPRDPDSSAEEGDRFQTVCRGGRSGCRRRRGPPLPFCSRRAAAAPESCWIEREGDGVGSDLVFFFGCRMTPLPPQGNISGWMENRTNVANGKVWKVEKGVLFSEGKRRVVKIGNSRQGLQGWTRTPSCPRILLRCSSSLLGAPRRCGGRTAPGCTRRAGPGPLSRILSGSSRWRRRRRIPASAAAAAAAAGAAPCSADSAASGAASTACL